MPDLNLSQNLFSLLEQIPSSQGFDLQFHNKQDLLIQHLCDHSKEALPDSLFFALPGQTHNGSYFIQDAIDRQARVIVCCEPLQEYHPEVCYIIVKERIREFFSWICYLFYQKVSDRLKIIGITGTDGKSSTTFFLYLMLKHLGYPVAFFNTVQFDIGQGLQENTWHMTTPSALVIHQLFYQAWQQNCEYFILECSSHALSKKLARVHNISFDMAVFTNLSQEHLDFHQTWEQYREDKSQLFAQLKANAPAILYFYDPNTPWMSEHVSSRSCFYYGLEKRSSQEPLTFVHPQAQKSLDFKLPLQPHYQGKITQENIEGIYFQCSDLWDDSSPLRDTHWIDQTVFIPIIGQFYVDNFLAALACVHQLSQIPMEKILSDLPKLYCPPGRSHRLNHPYLTQNNMHVLVDYAHTPEALQIFLPVLKKLTPGRLIILSGAPGHRDSSNRAIIGKIIDHYADIFILCDDHPRTERPFSIIQQLISGIEEPHAQITIIPNREKAAYYGISCLEPNDTFVLLGKGYEKAIAYADYVLDWDDYEYTQKALVLFLEKQKNQTKGFDDS